MKCKDCPEYEACIKAFDLKKRRPHCPIAQSGKPVVSSSKKFTCNRFYCENVGEWRCCRECNRFNHCYRQCPDHPSCCGAATRKVRCKPKGKITSLN